MPKPKTPSKRKTSCSSNLGPAPEFRNAPGAGKPLTTQFLNEVRGWRDSCVKRFNAAIRNGLYLYAAKEAPFVRDEFEVRAFVLEGGENVVVVGASEKETFVVTAAGKLESRPLFNAEAPACLTV
jgi:hypothetical protein